MTLDKQTNRKKVLSFLAQCSTIRTACLHRWWLQHSMNHLLWAIWARGCCRRIERLGDSWKSQAVYRRYRFDVQGSSRSFGSIKHWIRFDPLLWTIRESRSTLVSELCTEASCRLSAGYASAEASSRSSKWNRFLLYCFFWIFLNSIISKCIKSIRFRLPEQSCLQSAMLFFSILCTLSSTSKDTFVDERKYRPGIRCEWNSHLPCYSASVGHASISITRQMSHR